MNASDFLALFGSTALGSLIVGSIAVYFAARAEKRRGK